MKSGSRTRRYSAGAGLAATCLAALSCGARADVKIVAEVTVTSPTPQGFRGNAPPAQAPDDANSQAQPKPSVITRTITTYYKGKFARTEDATGLLVIYDGAANKVFTLHPDQKTYTVVSTKQALARAAAPMRGLPPGVSVDTAMKVEKTDESKSYVGKDARKYVVTATSKFSMDNDNGGFSGGGGFPGGGRSGGRGRHGGGFPGGDTGGGFPGGGGDMPGGGGSGRRGGSDARRGGLPTMEMEGELWFADIALLPSGNKSPLLPLGQLTVPGSPALKPLTDRMAKLKLIPLYSKVSFRTVRPGAVYNPTDNSTPPAQEPTVATMEIKSLEDGPLDDALFQVPSDYKKTAPPAEPGKS